MKNNKWLKYTIVLAIFLLVFCLSYYYLSLKKDFFVIMNVPCEQGDPDGNCFVNEDDNGEIFHYKLLKIKASDMPTCSGSECEFPKCDNETADCSYEYCEAGNEDGYICLEK